MEKRYQDINSRTIDEWVRSGWEWGRPITSDVYKRALNGDWDVLLTPTKPVPHEWFGSLKGKKLLGLASGGAQQMPIFAALGAECTVLDYSDSQLESERIFAQREGYDIRIVKSDMTLPFPFENGEFDIIFHPVSNCYARDVFHIFSECSRVLRRGGVLLSGLDNGINFMVDEDQTAIVNKLPYDPIAEGTPLDDLEAAGDGVQFSHGTDEQIGGQLKAGFILTDIYCDTNGSGRLHELGIDTFIATRAVKP